MYTAALLFLSAPLIFAQGPHAHGGATLHPKRATCSTPLGSGTCVSTSSCGGFHVAGYCPGAADIQCCISKDCTVGSNTGKCQNVAGGCSGGSFQGQVCPGDESISCCVKGSSSSSPAPSSSSAPAPSSSSSSGGDPSDPHPVNSASFDLIKSEEGFSANYYYIDGDKTVGYGHDCTQRGDCAGLSVPLTEAEGEALLRKDIVGYEDCVCQQPNASKLNANQYGALTSFTYNAGCGGLEDNFSSYFSKGDFSGACAALPSTETNGGELSSRRQREADLCKTATSDKSGC